MDKLKEMRGVQYETVPFRKHMIHLVVQAEFSSLPKFLRGTLTMQQINLAIESLNKVIFQRAQNDILELVFTEEDVPKEVNPSVLNVLCHLRRICPANENQMGSYVVCQQLFLIRKIIRKSSDLIDTLANYYILEGTIYQCPRIFSVVRSRLMNATLCFNAAFKRISQDVDFDTRKGHTWKSFPRASTSSSVTIEASEEDEVESARRARDRISMKRIISTTLKSVTKKAMNASSRNM